MTCAAGRIRLQVHDREMGVRFGRRELEVGGGGFGGDGMEARAVGRVERPPRRRLLEGAFPATMATAERLDLSRRYLRRSANEVRDQMMQRLKQMSILSQILERLSPILSYVLDIHNNNQMY